MIKPKFATVPETTLPQTSQVQADVKIAKDSGPSIAHSCSSHLTWQAWRWRLLHRRARATLVAFNMLHG
eukprot:CAMPEP_0172574780 /NCGR_PEP_ID=MMETSP1067-20121228/136875_1 /TAXON_ID=265564 ORGANISM="Thalassiosira punctigera, Strain Tpunct2005C2" /NCGR_SAMPLE_ID=MMETSP1067 /ASSEMBLY_ACC=CAM_ASM_000444 /LENGTH=68 /DNA_ID=CAMNT_0013367413 /DNA_START=1206 /DNA_END=1412 /DNA_ORIENTATION=-